MPDLWQVLSHQMRLLVYFLHYAIFGLTSYIVISMLYPRREGEPLFTLDTVFLVLPFMVVTGICYLVLYWCGPRWLILFWVPVANVVVSVLLLCWGLYLNRYGGFGGGIAQSVNAAVIWYGCGQCLSYGVMTLMLAFYLKHAYGQ